MKRKYPVLCAKTAEERLLTGFLANCRVTAQRTSTTFAKALSFADNCILTMALEKQADLIVSDDRLLRKTAAIEGFRAIGTIGVLIRAAKSSCLTPKKSVALLDELVRDHNFRISTSVYEIGRNTIGKIR